MPRLGDERVDEQLEPDREREGLVRLRRRRTGRARPRRASPASTSPKVTAPIETSATTGCPSELGIAIASGFVPASFGPPSGCAEPRGRGRGERARRARPRRAGAPSSRAPRSGSVRCATTTRACSGGCGELRLDDRGEREVAERAVAVPALVAGLGQRRARAAPPGRSERPRLEPLDPRVAVARLAAPLAVVEVREQPLRRPRPRSRGWRAAREPPPVAASRFSRAGSVRGDTPS